MLAARQRPPAALPAASCRQHLPGARLPARQRRGPRAAAAAAAGDAPPRLAAVLEAIDGLNAADPRSVEVDGAAVPYELAYSRWLSQWMAALEPAPSEELRIVARGQHVERWKSPRSSYPEGRTGYLQWREQLKVRHADTVTELMAQHGYDDAACERVRRFILKKDLKKDPENQVVEDALCLVFLQHQFADLLAKEGPDKMVDVVRKTWAKMGERGRAAALQVQLPPDQAEIVQRALSGA